MEGSWMAKLDDELVPYSEALTRRELQIVNLAADGLTNGEIARQLEVSENTVKYHLKNVMQKLHLQNRAQAVAYAAQHGWLNHRVHAN
jgi:DNA-binding NarL/FixJ family response regulator